MGGTSTTLVLGGIRMPLSACNTTFGFGNQLSWLCTEAGTDGWPRLWGVRITSASSFLPTLLGRGGRGEGADDDAEAEGGDADGLARTKAVCWRGTARKFAGCVVAPDDVLGGPVD